MAQLLEGPTPIAVSSLGDRGLKISVWMMQPGVHRIVLARLGEIFRKAQS